MGGRLSSLTRCIRNVIATWCEFCPEMWRKTKTITFCCKFFHSQIRMKNKQNKKRYFPLTLYEEDAESSQARRQDSVTGGQK